MFEPYRSGEAGMESRMSEAAGQISAGAAGGAARVKLLAAIGFGNILETFDFTVYSYFATLIGLVILKTKDPVLSTYISAILFGLGFLARPFGSVILGAYADRRGRKAALFITIALMGLGSALIAFAPPYTAIGLGAPALVLLGRLLQGFSAGGEIGAASALLLESAQARSRGLYVAWQFMMQGVSAAFGALCAYALFSLVPEASMRAWGWRVPFIFALLIIPVGLYIRAHIDETYAGGAGLGAPHPLKEIRAGYGRQFLLAMLMVMPVTLLIYITVIYMPTYLSLIQIKSGAAFLTRGSGRFMLTAATGLLLAAAALGSGFICDRLPRRKLFACLCLSIAFIACFAAYASVGTSSAVFLGSLMLAAAALGMLMVAQALMVLEAFPRAVRVSGMAVSMAVSASVFGGTAQAIVTKLMMATGQNPFAPFYYLGPMLLVGLAAFAAFREEHYA